VTTVRALFAALATALALAFAANADASAEGGAVVAWGSNQATQLGAGYRSTHQSSPVAVLGLGNVTAVAAGYHFSMALLADGTARAWGGNFQGQLGDGTRRNKATPVPVGGLSEARSLSVAGEHSMALLKNGTVLTWGGSQYGERGNGESGFEGEAKEKDPNLPARDVPTAVPSLEHVTAISSSRGADFALLENGTLMSWGEDLAGILGLGHAAPEECRGEIGALPCSTVPRPVLLPPGAKVTAVSGSYEAAYALLSTGEVLSWGSNAHGQLGNGTTDPTSTPGRVDLPKLEEELKTKLEVVAISGGEPFALALLRTGEVIGWGGNGMGELGGASTDECRKIPRSCSQTPKLVSGLAGVGEVSAGQVFSLVLKGASIFSFGLNEPWGQLGIGSTSRNSNVPTEIAGLTPISTVAAGEQHSLAVLHSGSPPPPEFGVRPEPGALSVSWTIGAEEFHLRWRTPPKSGHWSPMVESTGPCSPERVCGYTIGGLSKSLYEIQLVTFIGGVRTQERAATATPE
jgi:alpha-tubulin suppressor-like RCC1 family protein